MKKYSITNLTHQKGTQIDLSDPISILPPENVQLFFRSENKDLNIYQIFPSIDNLCITGENKGIVTNLYNEQKMCNEIKESGG